MKLVVRICLYVGLAMLAAYFFGRFRRSYNEGYERAQAQAQVQGGVTAPAEITTNEVATNEVVLDTNAPPTGVPGVPGVAAVLTNEVAGATNPVVPGVLTNLVGTASPTPPPAGSTKADSFRFLGFFVLVFLGLGGLAAWDLSHYYGSRAGRAIMAEDWIERKDPKYEKAEEEWSKGNHLDAITLMREYLAKNPREQHVALRIAEIYEKDLGNHLAAALELEEVLTKKLPREKWGWTAIRLANIYSGRLNQSAKAIKVLERIVNEYGDTAAAKKARPRLGLPEPVEEAPEAEEAAAAPAAEPEQPATPEPPPDAPDSAGSLPKGFRPKK